ncbi:hypothetical protein [Thalassospira mesophila]|uniref:Uncharacterized protein n=1 Tax=Thalassospira mesophila TaxID=1293891 RepID=A0A1Y2KXG2_9PROT|nr:hypothetical protein [Thalassospira mesophila]OSQ37027.1 hypothetical protein TMES_16425 [Thalassospira mesophila]
MNISEFENLLDQHGWDISSWPEPLRQEGNRFVAQNDEAAELIRHLHALEDDFAADPVPMGRHKAIDDIFGAIEAAESKAASGDDDDNNNDDDYRQNGTEADKAPMTDLSADHRAPLSEPGPAETARRHVPPGSPRKVLHNHHLAPGDGIAGTAGRVTARPDMPVTASNVSRTYVLSAVGMVLCVVFGFVFGVTFTARQGLSNMAEADELPVARIVDRHLYDLALPDNDRTGDETGTDGAEEKTK